MSIISEKIDLFFEFLDKSSPAVTFLVLFAYIIILGSILCAIGSYIVGDSISPLKIFSCCKRCTKKKK